MSAWWLEAPTPTGSVTALDVEPVWRSASGRVEVLRSERFGRLLIVDGGLVHAEAEASAREMLVHPALCGRARAARRVLLLGGSDGFVLAELLCHAEVEEIVVVDPDEEVRAAAQPLGHARVLSDPRVRLRPGSLALDDWTGEGDFDLVVPAAPSLSLPGGVLPDPSLLRRLLRPEGLMVDIDGIVLTTSGARWLRALFAPGPRWSDVAAALAPARATFLFASPLRTGQFQAVRLHCAAEGELAVPQRSYFGRYYHPALHTAATVLPGCFGALP